MTDINANSLTAILSAHAAMLLAMVETHPNREALRLVFEAVMSQTIANESDPVRSAVLTTFEQSFREALRAPPDPTWRPGGSVD